MNTPFSPRNAAFRLVTAAGISTRELDGKPFLQIQPETLARFAAEACRDASFYLRAAHLEQWVAILRDPEASPEERFVVGSLLHNAVIAAEGVLPLCQDTGTATVVARRGERVLTGGDDERWLAEGIARAYREHHLRFSQIVPKSMFDEANSGTNLPAQIDIGFTSGNEYHFLFMAKGGGSANKTALFQETKALLNPASLTEFLRTRIAALGVAACPPYHLAVVIGGTSPETNLKMLKLATAEALDHLPDQGDAAGSPFRDPEWEAIVCRLARETGLGAQFGGRWLALDARVIRLPRHAGSCPVSVGVSCSAHRNLLGAITAEGAYLEALETNPARHLAALEGVSPLDPTAIDLDKGMEQTRHALQGLAPGTLVRLSGTLIVARDLAHARLADMLRQGQPLPAYFRDHPVYYAGPAKTPDGLPIGSFGPTTAQRMDSYLEDFMARGASLVTLAKGNRAPGVADQCRRFGGTYLGTIGGAAALLAREHIRSAEVVDFPEFGMEAVRRIVVRDLPAFVVINSDGHSLCS